MFKEYKIRNYDFKLIIMVIALSIIGILAIGSAEASLQRKQIMGVILGVFLMFIVSLLDYTVLIRLNWLMYFGNLVLLILVSVMGDDAKGAQRWLEIGSFRFQPSETAKILLILFFAQFIMKHKEQLNTFKIIVSCLVLILIPWYLIYKQPDLSTSIVSIVIFCIIMFSGGISYKLIFSILLVTIPALILIVTLAMQPESDFLKGYQQKRILAFIYPEEYATDEAYQQLNSVMAIASGRLDGKGYMNNEITSVKNGNFVSDQQTDFIFSVIGEEFGFKGSFVVIMLFVLIPLECISVARKSSDLAGTIIASSVGGLIAFQGFFNIGVATFILPNTGLPLPFVSYGLTSIVSLYIGIGFVLSVKLKAKNKSKNYDRERLKGDL